MVQMPTNSINTHGIVGIDTSVFLMAGITLLVLVLIGIYIFIHRNRQIYVPDLMNKDQETYHKEGSIQAVSVDNEKFFEESWEVQEPVQKSINLEAIKRKPEPPSFGKDGDSGINVALEGLDIPPDPMRGEKTPTMTPDELQDDQTVEQQPTTVVEERHAYAEDIQMSEDIKFQEQAGTKAEPASIPSSLDANKSINKNENPGAAILYSEKLEADEFINTKISTDSLDSGRNGANIFNKDHDISSKDQVALISQKSSGLDTNLLPKHNVNEIVDATRQNQESQTRQAPGLIQQEKAEEQSLAEVHFNIGVMFSMGDGVTKNDVQAVKWFLKSAEEGYPEAQFNVGRCYLEGIGVAKNIVLGLEWLEKAAANNFELAKTELRERNQAS